MGGGGVKRLITIRLTDEMLEHIDQRARLEGLDRTKLVERAIGFYCNLPGVYTKPVEADTPAPSVYTKPEPVYTDAIAPPAESKRGKVSLPTIQPGKHGG